MRILERSVYVGPSQFAHFPVIRLLLDLGALEQWPSARLGGGFIDGLVAALPGLAEHGCSYREPGGFLRRMREGEGTWLGHVLEHVAIELQNIAGEDVTFGKPRSVDGRPGVYTVVYEYAQREEGIAAGDQYVHAQPEHAHRIVLVGVGHRGELQVVGVDHGDRAAALDLERVVGRDEGGGVLVQADADGERVVGQRRGQAAEAVALAEMLVDHEAVGQAQPRCQAHAAGARRGALAAEGDHVLAEETGAGAGAGHGHALGVAQADAAGHVGAAEDGGQAQLVATGEEDAAGLGQACQPAFLLAVAAGVEVQHFDPWHAHATEQLLVAWTGVLEPAGGRDDRDVGLAAAAQFDETLQDARVGVLVLGTADRDDPATLVPVDGLAWHRWLRCFRCLGWGRIRRRPAAAPRRHAAAGGRRRTHR